MSGGKIKEKIKGLVIAGTQSGSGKTTLTLGLLAALVRRGLRVVSFKVGPDFIDPGHHTRITGRPARNLDGWMLDCATNRRCFLQGVQGADVAVVEGVMGLYDGYDGRSEAGSTAQMAKWLGLPVVLAVDARSMARSAAALVQGFQNFDPQVTFAGVLFNRIGSPGHLDYLRQALENVPGMPCLGGIPRESAITIPERHLGLVTQEEHGLDGAQVARLAALIEDSLDIDALLAALPSLTPQSATGSEPDDASGLAPKGARIGVDRDAAFCFYYQDNLDLLEAAGAQLVFFSPLSDLQLPAGLDGLYLGGGYPELHARRLAANDGLCYEIQAMSRRGIPIYGECGGFMYLCRELVDQQGDTWPMTGCFPFATRMLARRKALGYREVRLSEPCLLGRAGARLRGHEFHYSQLEQGHPLPSEIQCVYRIAPRGGAGEVPEGYQRDQTLGSYLHLHFGSRPASARQFVEACATYRTDKDHRL
jgi:cobyrinic acid a,c-diamide synthase